MSSSTIIAPSFFVDRISAVTTKQSHKSKLPTPTLITLTSSKNITSSLGGTFSSTLPYISSSRRVSYALKNSYTKTICNGNTCLNTIFQIPSPLANSSPSKIPSINSLYSLYSYRMSTIMSDGTDRSLSSNISTRLPFRTSYLHTSTKQSFPWTSTLITLRLSQIPLSTVKSIYTLHETSKASSLQSFASKSFNEHETKKQESGNKMQESPTHDNNNVNYSKNLPNSLHVIDTSTNAKTSIVITTALQSKTVTLPSIIAPLTTIISEIQNTDQVHTTTNKYSDTKKVSIFLRLDTPSKHQNFFLQTSNVVPQQSQLSRADSSLIPPDTNVSRTSLHPRSLVNASTTRSIVLDVNYSKIQPTEASTSVKSYYATSPISVNPTSVRFKSHISTTTLQSSATLPISHINIAPHVTPELPKILKQRLKINNQPDLPSESEITLTEQHGLLSSYSLSTAYDKTWRGWTSMPIPSGTSISAGDRSKPNLGR